MIIYKYALCLFTFFLVEASIYPPPRRLHCEESPAEQERKPLSLERRARPNCYIHLPRPLPLVEESDFVVNAKKESTTLLFSTSTNFPRTVSSLFGRATFKYDSSIFVVSAIFCNYELEINNHK